MTGSLLHWHWKASIISHLSVVIPSIPFSNGAELIQSPYQITIVKGTALTSAFESAVSGELKILWDSKFINKEKSMKNNISGLIEPVKNEKYALFEGDIYIKSLPEYKDCSIVDTGYQLFSFKLGFLIAKNSPFTDIFNYALSKLQESGELNRIKRKYRSKEPECGQAKGRSLGFDTIGFAFAVFVFGPVLAGICFLGEIVRRKWKTRQEDRILTRYVTDITL